MLPTRPHFPLLLGGLCVQWRLADEEWPALAGALRDWWGHRGRVKGLRGERERWLAAQCIKERRKTARRGRESARGLRHRPLEQGGTEQRRKSGREKSNKRVNDCRISALKWKGVFKKKEQERERERESNPCGAVWLIYGAKKVRKEGRERLGRWGQSRKVEGADMRRGCGEGEGGGGRGETEMDGNIPRKASAGRHCVGDHTWEAKCHDRWGQSMHMHCHTHMHTKTQANKYWNCLPAARGQSSHFQQSYMALRLGELNTHTRTGLFICLPFRILLHIIAINRFALMRLSDAENCQAAHYLLGNQMEIFRRRSQQCWRGLGWVFYLRKLAKCLSHEWQIHSR